MSVNESDYLIGLFGTGPQYAAAAALRLSGSRTIIYELFLKLLPVNGATVNDFSDLLSATAGTVSPISPAMSAWRQQFVQNDP